MAGVVAAKLKLKKQQQEEEEAKVGWPAGAVLVLEKIFSEQIRSQLVSGGEGGLL